MRRYAPALLSAAASGRAGRWALAAAAPAAAALSRCRRPISSCGQLRAAGGDRADPDMPSRAGDMPSKDPRQRSVQGGDPAAATSGMGAAATAAATGRLGGFRGLLPGEPDLSGFRGGQGTG
jgi:hypothetical protein